MTILQRLRASLSVPPPANLLRGDLVEGNLSACIPAAVLIAIKPRADPGVVLTVRREHLRQHAGQIAFPGGRVDGNEDATSAALREASEEIGLDPSEVIVWGLADAYRTVTGYEVQPIVGQIRPDVELTPQESEVAECFEAPLTFLIDPSNHHLRAVEYQGAQRTYFEINWNGRRIWGATAAMIVNLSRRMQA